MNTHLHVSSNQEPFVHDPVVAEVVVQLPIIDEEDSYLPDNKSIANRSVVQICKLSDHLQAMECMIGRLKMYRVYNNGLIEDCIDKIRNNFKQLSKDDFVELGFILIGCGEYDLLRDMIAHMKLSKQDYIIKVYAIELALKGQDLFQEDQEIINITKPFRLIGMLEKETKAEDILKYLEDNQFFREFNFSVLHSIPGYESYALADFLEDFNKKALRKGRGFMLGHPKIKTWLESDMTQADPESAV